MARNGDPFLHLVINQPIHHNRYICSMSIQEQPLVSIIMAARDTEPYLVECLDSITDQTYPNWELIAINDHSVDATEAILKSYEQQDKRVRVFNSQREKLIPALKEAYAHRRGTLINRMDSDDRMPHDKLEVMVAEWLKHGRGTIIAGGTQHFVDEGEVGGGFLRYEKWLNKLAASGGYYEEIYQECVIPSHCWLIHHLDFEAVGGFEPETYPEDYDLCFRFYQAQYQVVGLNKILHYWRDRSERISRTWDEYKDNRYFNLKLKYFYQLDREHSRPLVIWGAGRNGKDLIKSIPERESQLHWVCDNERKIGKDIYQIRLWHFSKILDLVNPQILIAVSSPNDRQSIRNQLEDWNKLPAVDYWFFS